ncbi:MAG: transcription elongation factor GreA [Chloroflexi bacterium]|nr:transcription elongation factor GreA [Chloroflexota bacterium]MCH8230703.1 transcription elongation factor GreA [Chloroflexota bacterium]
MATTSEAPHQIQEEQEALSLSVAFQTYVRQLPRDAKRSAQPEIAKFVRWIGGQRAIDTLIPSEIGEYNEVFGARTATRDATERLSAVKLFLAFLKKKGHIEINLAQHLRLRKSRTAASKAITMANPTRSVRLTQSGFNEMTKQLSQLQDERIRIVEDIQKAAADGDVRENAPLEAAREAQGMAIGKIREIEATLKVAVIIDATEQDSGRVHVGSKVELTETGSGKTLKYQIVEPNEANPLTGKISIVSPVGSAILGHKLGDEVKVKTPSGQQVYKVVKTS